MKKIFCAVLIILLFVSSIFAADKADNSTTLEREREIGRKTMKQIEEQWPLTTDPAITSRLEMILNKLEPFMERRINWEIRLVKTENMNAFCLPGGFIFFTTGIVDALKTDSELAAVMAHEMIHADQRHSLRMAADTNKVTLATLATMLLSGGAAAPIILAGLAQVAITSSYTLKLEQEADRLGLEALIKSGYSPTGMITLFERFMAEEYKQPLIEYGIYMNHPESKQRLADAVKFLHDKNIPIERKYPLGLLRTDIKENNVNAELLIDGLVTAKSIKTPEARTILRQIRENIDKYLQLELAPYELHIVNGALYIGNNYIVGNVDGVTSPEELRENLLKALNLARAKHPTSKFFK